MSKLIDLGAILSSALSGLALATVTSAPSLAQTTAGAPNFMLPYGSGWSGGINRGNGLDAPSAEWLPEDYYKGETYRADAIARGIQPKDVDAYLRLRVFGHNIPPVSGIGPVMDSPAKPYFNNAVARELHVKGTVRIADLTSEPARNLKPWALEALRKQNALAAEGKNIQTRQARCWQLGVPNFDDVPQPLYFIQTPKEVVMYMGHRVRHIYMNVPHSKVLKPTWYGESVGRYEGDTLVVDTIGQNDKTFVDGYRTPHTAKIHVVERFRIVHGGSGMDTTYTVDDPDAFYRPWSARRPRYLVTDNPLTDKDRICAVGSEDRFNEGLEPLQRAASPDF
jgi:hypothetical protein